MSCILSILYFIGKKMCFSIHVYLEMNLWNLHICIHVISLRLERTYNSVWSKAVPQAIKWYHQSKEWKKKKNDGELEGLRVPLMIGCAWPHPCTKPSRVEQVEAALLPTPPTSQESHIYVTCEETRWCGGGYIAHASRGLVAWLFTCSGNAICKCLKRARAEEKCTYVGRKKPSRREGDLQSQNSTEWCSVVAVGWWSIMRTPDSRQRSSLIIYLSFLLETALQTVLSWLLTVPSLLRARV
jgi:hypothetical protein